MNTSEKFLIKNGLHESCYDFENCVTAFTEEMAAGLGGQESSLLMLPSYIGISPKGTKDGNIIAVDAGGTNLRIALVHLGGGTPPVIVRQEKYRLPGWDGVVHKGEFFLRIAEYIAGIWEGAPEIGFCFSFPSEIDPDRDGKIVGFKKEVRVSGAEGAYVGGELNAAFVRIGLAPKKITVMNDTVAALVGTLALREPDRAQDYGCYMAFVYGTGANFCYYDKERKMIINAEAGGYNGRGFPASACDAAVDAGSEIPGDNRLEKMVSGAYFPKLALSVLQTAAREGLFSAETSAGILALTELSFEQIGRYMLKQGGDKDGLLLYEIMDGLYERIAKLFAMQTEAALRINGRGDSTPALIVCEGSGFSKGYGFQERFERRLGDIFGSGGSYEIATGDDLVIVGAAAAVHF